MDDNQAVQEKPAVRLPRRAWNLIKHILKVEHDNGGRCRLTVNIVMNDGDWWVDFSAPGKVVNMNE